MAPSYWTASNAAERSKLAPKESDWNLAGLSSTAPTTRTRHGGNGRPTLHRRWMMEVEEEEEESVASDSSYNSSDEESCTSEELDDDVLALTEKPPATRVILEVDSLTKAVETNSICKECNGSLALVVKTTCLASSIVLSCCNSDCGFVYHAEQPAATTIHERTNDNRERNTDYAANVMYVVSFLSMGDGGSEAARLLELLGLPNDTTMESRSFTIIEERIGPVIRSLTEDILLENLTEEVKLTMEQSEHQDNNDFTLWKSALDPLFCEELSIAKYPRITVSYDMAWQQRSSGHSYRSPSGHALMVGALTRKPVAMCVKSKLCSFCSSFKKKNAEVQPEEYPLHECWKNHTGSSKGMEPKACLDMTIEMFDKRHVIIKGIVIDDDASTKALVRWSNQDWMLNNNTTLAPKVLMTKGANKGKWTPRPNKGKLPRHIPEPTWVHDPNHRRRVMTGDLHRVLASGVKNKFTMTKMDITRLAKNYGYMVHSLNLSMSDEAMTAAGKAVLEHHFDNHEFCGDWCRRKLQTPQQRLASQRYYRCKTKDELLYLSLVNLLSRFLTLENLQEVAHGLDTQVNESFNNAASWLAPKNKVYCATGSLSNRLGIALGIFSIGSEIYFKRLFKGLGVTATPNVLHCLKVKGDKRQRQLQFIQTKAAKKNRQKRKHEQLVNDEKTARVERDKREGTYSSGMNVAEGAQDGYTAEELLSAAADPTGKSSASKKKTSRSQLVCPHCYKKGHSTMRSRHCLMNPRSSQQTTAATESVATMPTNNGEEDDLYDNMAQLALDDADDADRMDSMPLQDDAPSDFSDQEQFYDVGTWSDSETEDTMTTGAI
jgi:hypothetical protein